MLIPVELGVPDEAGQVDVKGDKRCGGRGWEELEVELRGF
jgi:hypothetical protein